MISIGEYIFGILRVLDILENLCYNYSRGEFMNQLSCENEFCIYQNLGTCILESIQLDIQGNCTDCIYINIEEDALNILKQRLLKKLDDLRL